MGRPELAVLDRLADKFTVGDECWEWSGKKSPAGYGRVDFKRTGRTTVAHVLLWVEMNGPVPVGTELHHTCGNKGCVRPGHLTPLTRSQHLFAHADTKTHCNHGHSYAEHGYYFRQSGTRECRMCCLLRSRSYR